MFRFIYVRVGICLAVGFPAAWPVTVALASEPAATPYRPSVSSPAALSSPGFWELEAGWQRTTGEAGRTGFPLLLKYAFSEDFGVLLGTEAVASQEMPGRHRRRGLGDSSLTLKWRFPMADDRAFGLEASAKLPTAADGLGSGRPDYTLNGIYSVDFAAYHGDINLTYTRLGVAEDGGAREQLGWAAGLSRDIAENWGATVELSGQVRHGARGTAQALFAVSRSVSPTLVLDAGCARQIAGEGSDWSVFLGGTWLMR